MMISEITMFTTAFGVLVILTNALAELFKGMIPKLPASITATVIGLLLTICAVFTYLAINNIAFEWYIAVGAVIGGFFVSYTAQYGYDKFHEIVKILGGGEKK